MKTDNSGDKVAYHLPVADGLVDMNALIGQQITLRYLQEINCSHCGRKTNKSFAQGYCYPCMQKLAQCDSCIMSPEKCHYDAGTCREPEWGEKNCMTDHIVYLANSSGLKVGITRGTQVPTRWMDQGAVDALPIMRVSTRLLSGLVEVVFKQYTADKTNWRKMLKNEVPELDLTVERERLFDLAGEELDHLMSLHGFNAIQFLDDAPLYHFDYPVIEYPIKVTSFNLDKNPMISGKLMGIKGQYLILDGGVINMRKYTSYQLEVSVV
ncbi:MAG: DUF2797 domain-containing protein [Pseudomonadales bacterium]|nr:DUF2797 domain-containing protein [Pseudomonadales bacterium]